VLRETIERQRAAGIPLGLIMDSLVRIYDQATKQASHTLKQLRVSSPNFDGIMALHQDQMAWVRYNGKECARLFGIMAERNDRGKASERQGQYADTIRGFQAYLDLPDRPYRKN
jgi:hypothetical protein